MQLLSADRDDSVICERCVLAASSWKRLRGLLFRASLPSGEGLLIEPAFSIHMFFMRFPVDAVFLDRDLRVVGVRSGLRPWRVATVRGARSVLELSAGEVARRGVTVGERLRMVERPAAERSPGFADLSPDYRWSAVGTAAALAAASLAHFGLGAHGWIAATFAATLAVLAAIDLQYRVIPNRIVLPVAVAIFVAQVLFFDRTFEWLAAGAGAALVMLIPALIRPGSVGMGDVKLGLLLGFGLGKQIIPGLMLASFAAFPVALYILVKGGAEARKQAIPFGPFLATGGVLALFLG